MSDSPILRQAVRAILLDQRDRVLLVRYEFTGVDVWCAPGGGIDRDEDRLGGLRRELLEETGLDIDGLDVGPCVAHRVHLFEMSGYDGQEEWFYALRVPSFVPSGRFSAEELRAENLHELRWWSLPELQAAITVVPEDRKVVPTDGSRLAVTGPRDLPLVLERWLADGLPTEMMELGV